MIIIIVKVTITVLGNINVFNTQIITPQSVGRKQKQNLNKKMFVFYKLYLITCLYSSMHRPLVGGLSLGTLAVTVKYVCLLQLAHESSEARQRANGALGPLVCLVEVQRKEGAAADLLLLLLLLLLSAFVF